MQIDEYSNDRMCEICGNPTGKQNVCKMCGNRICDKCKVSSSGICLACNETLCMICRSAHSSRACDICGTLVCEDDSMKDGEATICAKCLENRSI